MVGLFRWWIRGPLLAKRKRGSRTKRTNRQKTSQNVKLPFLLLSVAAVAAPLCLHGQQLGTDDGANAKLRRVNNMHGTRYIEVFVIQGDPDSK